MAFNLPLNFVQVPSSSDTISVNDSEDQFYAIVERLKRQKVLSSDSFIKELPFFNFSSVSKESQIKELFQDVSDPNLYKALIQNILSSPEGSSELLTKRLSAMQVMGFAQIILYKVLPCCEANCPNAPREVAPRNQYKDYEYSCPFYHHDKDKRRLVITPRIEDEFIYKANYLVEGKGGNAEDKEKHSLNYFESMFHPLYYKMFKCKREHCNFSQFCPFFHSEEEKKTWDNMFSNFIRKDRISYVKDKQKYYESNTNGQQQVTSPTTPKSNINACRNQNSRSNYKPKNSKNQQQAGSPIYQNNPRTEGQFYRRIEPNSAGKWEHRKRKNFADDRKNSGDSYEGNSSPFSFGTFCNPKEAINNRVC